MRRSVMRKTWLFLAMGLFLRVPATVHGGDGTQWLVSKDLLDPVKLVAVWQTTLPVRQGERLEMLMVLANRLYVRSTENYVWSLDRTSGDIIFSCSIAPAGFPIFGWNLYDDRLITVIDNQLVELDANTGTRKRVSDLGLSIIAPPVRNSEFFYVSAADRRLHMFRVRNLVEAFKVAADNNSLIDSVIAGEDMVVFATDAGNLVAMAPDAPKKLWQFDAVESMAGPVIRDGRSFFFASEDTCVYRVDASGINDVSLAWKYQTEAILDRAPRVTATAVYQYAPGRGVTAIGRQSGKALWSLPEGVDLLAEAGNKAYVFAEDKTLVVMDNASGDRLFWVNFADVSDYAANVADAKIYVAGRGGRILCVQPIR
jgi:outer membrane protein assembly factor BamB